MTLVRPDFPYRETNVMRRLLGGCHSRYFHLVEIIYHPVLIVKCMRWIFERVFDSQLLQEEF